MTRRLVLALLVMLAGCASVQLPSSPESPETPQSRERSAPPVTRSPFAEPPGVLVAEVTQANIASTICLPGWTATVWPSSSFTQGLKRLMMSRAGLDPKDAIKYELDHFVPLAIGGHPRSEDNLWLQSWDGKWSARIKDRLERRLQVMVCDGKITLQTARTAIQHDWHAAFGKYVGQDPATAPREMELEEEEVVE